MATHLDKTKELKNSLVQKFPGGKSSLKLSASSSLSTLIRCLPPFDAAAKPMTAFLLHK